MNKMNFYLSILMLIFFQSAWAQKQLGKDFNKSEVRPQSEKKTAEIEHATQNGSATAHPGCGNHNIPKEYQHHDSQSDIEDYLRFVRNTQRTLGTRNAACIEIPVSMVVVSKSDGTGSDSDTRLRMVMETVNQMCRSSNLSIRFKITRLHRLNDDYFYTAPYQTQGYKLTELRDRFTDYPRALPLVIVGDCGTGGVAGVEWLAATNKYYGPNTWLHEMGHFLGLIHTHGDDNPKELVNGSNCSTAGDLVCDTPADPMVGGWVVNCQYTGQHTDPNNQRYSPDVRNIMAYSDGRCQDKLTRGQEDRIRYHLQRYYPLIVPSSNCEGGGGGSCQVAFKNTGCQTAELFWSDFDPRSFGTIAPGQTKIVNSHGGATWIMKVGSTEVGNYNTNCGSTNYSFNSGGCSGGSGSTLECEANVNNGGWQILGSCAVTVPAGQRLQLAVNPNGLSSYQWSGPNGFNRAGDADGNILISDAITSSQAGNYIVTVNNNGTTSTKTIQVTVTGGGGSLTFVGEANVNNGGWQILSGGAVTVPAGQRLELSANPNGASSYQWTGPNGFSGTGNADGNILISNAITTSQAGTYTVTFNSNGALASIPIQVTVTGGGGGSLTFECEANVNNGGWQNLGGNCAVTVPAGQRLELSANPNGASSYQWTGPNGFSGIGNSDGNILVSEAITPSQAGTYTVTFTSGGALASLLINVTVTGGGLTVAVNGSTTVCSGQTTTLTASGGTTYKWSNGSTNASITVGVGTYTVTATNPSGSTGVKTVTVTQSGTITASISGITTVCSGQATTLTASGGSSYRWSNGSTNASITVGVGTYTVTATNAGGCTGTKTVTVTQGGCSGTATFSATKCYRFNIRHSGKVMEVGGHSTVNGGNVQQWSWYGAKSQIWRIKDIGSGLYQIVNGNSGRVLDVSGVSTAAGANVHQWQWLNANNQKWKLTRNTEGYYIITAQHSGKALDVFGAGTQDGANIVQWTVHNGRNQQFQIAETTCPAGTAALQSAYILTAEGHRDGSKAVINWVSNANQQADYFVVEKLNDKAQEFEKLALVNAKYSLTDDNTFYSITDNNPIEGENYYRVALYREGDTTPQYSGLVTVDFSHLTNYHLYPNPANDIINIELEAVQKSEVTIFITDLSGKIIQQTRFEAAPKSAQIAINDISNGQYLIHIDAKNHRKVIKKLAIIR